MKKLASLFAVFLLIPLFTVASESGDRDIPAEVAQLTDSLKKQFAPDRRVALLDIDYSFSDKNVMLRGVTTSAEAKNVLLKELARKGYTVMDCLELLPRREGAGRQNLRYYQCVCGKYACRSGFFVGNDDAEFDGDASARIAARWLDAYPDSRQLYRLGASWGVHPVTEEEMAAWNKAEKIVVTAHYGFVYSEPNQTSQTVSDVVAGNRLKWEGSKGAFYKVTYPDGRRGYISKSIAMPEKKWRSGLQQDAAGIIRTAHTMMGIPYLWAGTSSKGVDCSGFMRTILFMHDIIIPRDASQQAYVGEHIDIAADFSNLQPGDLIFFGRKGNSGT